MTKELDVRGIQQAVRKKYAEVSRSVAGKFKYVTGRAGAAALGYDLSVVGDMPDELVELFCGVGNPFSLGAINPGEAVLDVGCGAGFVLLVATRFVGQAGRVCGIDLTPEMVEKAQVNLMRAGVPNAQVQLAGSEAIPYDDGAFDVVISNGVLNLSPLKEESFREIFRVLKPHGRLQFADIVLKEDLPGEVASSLEAWSDWVGGAIPVRDLIELMTSVGFVRVEYVGTTGVTTSKFTVGAMFRAGKRSHE